MSTTLSPGQTKCFFASANLLDNLKKPPFWWREDQFSGKATHYYFHQLLYRLKVNYASS